MPSVALCPVACRDIRACWFWLALAETSAVFIEIVVGFVAGDITFMTREKCSGMW